MAQQEKTPQKKYENIEIVKTYEQGINRNIEAATKFIKDAEIMARASIQGLIGDFISKLEENNFHFPNYLISVQIDSFEDKEKQEIHRIRHFKEKNRLVETKQSTVPDGDSFLMCSQEEEETVVREMDSKDWIKYGPTIISEYAEFVKKAESNKAPNK